MKLNVKRTVLVGLAFMTISGFWQLYDFMIPLILKDVFYVSDTISGFVMALDNILALILMPLFGSLSDKVSTKFGKRMPFIVVGTIVTTLTLLLIPTAATQKSLVMFIVGLGIVLLALAMYRSPAVALMPDVTLKPLRSKGNAIINLMGAVGGVTVLGIVILLGPAKTMSYFPSFIATSLFMLIPVLAMVIFVKENPWADETKALSVEYKITEEEAEMVDEKEAMKPEVKRSLVFFLLAIAFWFMGYNAVISAFSRYATHQINLDTSQAAMSLQIANIGAIISFIPIGAVSSKIGRKKMIQIGVVVLTFAFSTAFFYQSFSPLMYGNFLLAGFGWAAINVNSLPMVLEMAKGTDTGRFTGLYYTFSMSAQVITPILSGFLFDVIGYQILFPYAGFFVALSFIMVLFVHHGDSKLTDYDEMNLEDVF